MAGHYQILLPLLSIFVVRVDLTDLIPLQLPVEILKVYDGDTVLVRYRNSDFKIRLDKIDAPEKGQRFLGSTRDAGNYSTSCLRRILGKEKSLILVIRSKDIYGRILGDINNISFKMVEAGCSSLYPYASFQSVKEKMHYLKALSRAKRSKRGLWKYGGTLQPKAWRKLNKRYVGRQSRR